MNKKTYILSFIALVFLVGIVWFGNQNNNVIDQTASIVEINQEQVNEEDYIIGNPEATVTMIEYSSHFCGYCSDFHKDTLPVLMDKYIKTGQVKLIPRFVSPPEIGLSLFCAEEEGKFLEMSDYFFEHAQELQTVDDVKLMALKVVSDKESFEVCYDSKKYEYKVEAWFNQANEAGISGTPTFFINGEKLTGNQPVNVFEQAIEKALE